MIEQTNSSITYTADGVQTEWTYPYPFLNNSDINLYITIGAIRTKISQDDFVFNTTTKKITYPLVGEPVAAGSIVEIVRETPLTQLEDSSIVAFKSNDVERIADKLTLAVQDIKDFTNKNVDNIGTVARNIDNVNTVAGNTTNINTVANDSSNIATVASISSEIANVSSISTAITNVNDNETNINTVSDNLANINTVASNMNSVLTTANDITNINTVAGDKTNIDKVATYISSVRLVGDDINSVRTVAVDISNVIDVAENKTNIDTVATNISDINTTVSNMSAIIAAPTQASNAATSATNAQKWAEGADSDVTPLGGTHSSKGWANLAQQLVESLGSVLRYKGSKATYADLPSSGNQIGDMWNVLADGANYAWDGTGWDALSGVVDLSAYRTSAAQDIIDSGKQATLVSGTNIKTINSNSILGSGNLDIDALPSQTGQSGKFLTTNGTTASWAEVPIPQDVYTQENLVAGTNISFSQVPSPAIDINTIALWHLDDSLNDAINELALGGKLTTEYHKFGDGAGYEVNEYASGFTSWSTAVPGINFLTDSFTVDGWVYFGSNGNRIFFGAGYLSGYNFCGTGILLKQSSVRALVNHTGDDSTAAATVNLTENGWYHLAVQQDYDNQKIQFFLNGTMFHEATARCQSIYGNTTVNIANPANDVRYDEIRVSNIARYPSTGFTPFTAPYSNDAPAVHEVNCTLKALPTQTGQSGKFLTTDGTDASWATIPAGVSADGTTIQDTSNVFTTIGVKDQKTSNANKMWTGTKAEYDAIVSKDANTFYHITDDEPNTVAYAKADLSNLTHGLENTICTTPATTTSTATSAKPAVVVENYVNGTSWYRVYSDGWCEQGGYVTGFTQDLNTIYLLKEFADTNYSLLTLLKTNVQAGGQASSFADCGYYSKATDSFVKSVNTTYQVGFDWVACGYIA